jgi:hypothetical protein
MSDTENTPEIEDVEGHLYRAAEDDDVIGHKDVGDPTGDDVEGHRTHRPVTEDDEDVIGHRTHRPVTEDDEDVIGHRTHRP